MTEIVVLPVTDWDATRSAAERERGLSALEAGNVLLFPHLQFPLLEGEASLLSPAAAGRAKNVSYDPVSGVLRGSDDAYRNALLSMMARFAARSGALVRGLVPGYAESLQPGRTSYRPVEIAGRATSWRADDTRLHVDSFPSRPVHGTRILRVFTNVHSQGGTRSWRLGEPFEAVAQRYARSLSAPVPGASLALRLLGITKSRRSPYDHYMLQLHDSMKRDAIYQEKAPQLRHEFLPGSTWVLFTDQIPHAAMSGQYALEQTFHLPVHAMQDPSRSPLKVLERLLGRQLT